MISEVNHNNENVEDAEKFNLDYVMGNFEESLLTLKDIFKKSTLAEDPITRFFEKSYYETLSENLCQEIKEFLSKIPSEYLEGVIRKLEESSILVKDGDISIFPHNFY